MKDLLEWVTSGAVSTLDEKSITLAWPCDVALVRVGGAENSQLTTFRLLSRLRMWQPERVPEEEMSGFRKAIESVEFECARGMAKGKSFRLRGPH